MTRYCRQCGAGLKENARFCSACGSDVIPDRDSSPGTSQTGQANASWQRTMLVGAAAMAGGLALAFAIAWAAGWIDRSGQPGSATSSAAETGGARPADWFETYEDAFLSDGVTQYTTGPANKRSDKPNYYVNLEPGTEYRWNVAACNTSGCSKYTERLYFRTP